MAFMRSDNDHHNIVLFAHPTKVTAENRNAGYNALHCKAASHGSRSHRDRHLTGAVAASGAKAGRGRTVLVASRGRWRIANCPHRADPGCHHRGAGVTQLGLPMLIDGRLMTAIVAVALAMQDMPRREEA